MPRGRPIKSQIRQNIVDILYFIKQGYGYGIYKIYVNVFPKATMRSIYYHLKKGLDLEEFKKEKIQKEQGDYSWGKEAEKVYYKLGKHAKPTMNKKLKDYLDRNKIS